MAHKLIISLMLILQAGTAFAEELSNCSGKNKPQICRSKTAGTFIGKSKYQRFLDFYRPTCEPMEAVHLKIISDLHDIMPTIPQKALCSLKNIFIIDGNDLGASAFISVVPDLDKEKKVAQDYAGFGEKYEAPVFGQILAINLALINSKETIEEKLNRLFNERIGFLYPEIKSTDFPKYVIETNQGNWENSALLHTIIHELGHVLDNSNRPTDYNEENSNYFKLSWSQNFIELEDRPPYRLPILSEKSAGVLWGKQKMTYESFIADFLNSSFYTWYSMRNVEEDFADHFMLFFMKDAHIKSGNLAENIKNRLQIKNKMVFIDNFINDKNLNFDITKNGKIMNYYKENSEN